MPVDLHVHTTASDGVSSPSSVVTAAISAGLAAIAITDHDTVDAVDEALAAAAGSSLTVVPGIELSVDDEAAHDIHLLGLFIDHHNPALLTTLARLRECRVERARAMVAALAEAGHRIDFASVRGLAQGGSIGRVHVARALVAAGSAATVDEAFRLLVGRDAPFYVHKRTLSAVEAVSAVHGAGGVAVFAHPGVSGDAGLPALIAAGVDGIEAFHAEHTASDRERFAAVAARHGLLVTGGSDFHGPGLHSAPIGGGACPEDAVEALKARATLYRP